MNKREYAKGVQIVKDTGRPIHAVAKELGLVHQSLWIACQIAGVRSDTNVGRWKRKAKKGVK